MHLALGRSRANRAPGDQIRIELRHDRIQKLAASRKTQIRHIEQETTRPAEAFADREAAVESGIVDQALPANRGARLFEVDAHHDQQIPGHSLADRRQSRRVLESRLWIVNRTRADDQHQAVVATRQDLRDRVAALGNRIGLRFADGQVFDQDLGRHQGPNALDSNVVDLLRHRSPLASSSAPDRDRFPRRTRTRLYTDTEGAGQPPAPG